MVSRVLYARLAQAWLERLATQRFAVNLEVLRSPPIFRALPHEIAGIAKNAREPGLAPFIDSAQPQRGGGGGGSAGRHDRTAGK